MESHISDISRTIQLAVAPVFLLTAISTLIMALNNRLGRVIDRRRVLIDKIRKVQPVHGVQSPVQSTQPATQALSMADANEVDEWHAENEMISRRLGYIYLAILFAVSGALCICLVVASAFVGALSGIDLARTVAVLFIAAMVAMIACLSMFLREVFLAVAWGRRFLPDLRSLRQ